MSALLTLVFILSGAAGLIYESIWSRYLGLFVGHAAYAQVIVLVIYLGGMSAGAAIAARRSDRTRDPLIAYAFIEIAAGVLGLLFHWIFGAVTGFAYSSIFPALAGGAALVIVKWTIASLLILPQAVLLGTTFPFMTAGFLRRVSPDGQAHSGRVLGMLYFANSIGAAGGVLVTGFYLIRMVGLPGAILAAAAVNLFVGLTVYAAVRLTEGDERDNAGERGAAPADAQPHDPAETRAATAPPPLAPPPSAELPLLWRVMLVVAAGTAVSSFIYEIAWVRMLSLVLGSATHSFELMLSAFILGLACGAFWVRNRADAFRSPIRALAIAQWAMGGLAVFTLTAYLRSFDWMAFLVNGLDHNPQGYAIFTVAKYGIAIAVMLPATFCAGLTLPLITRILLGAGAGERAIGIVYSVNTLGSIVGAALAALVLMPLIGLKPLLISGAVIDMALGVWLMLLIGRTHAAAHRFGVALVGATVLIVAGGAVNADFDRGLLASGVFRYGRVPGTADSRNIVFYRDGRTATVSVLKGENGGYSISTNGKPDASLAPVWFVADTSHAETQRIGGDESTQVLLPLTTLAHVPHARHAAVIGNGSGMSSHFLLGSPEIEDLTTIDIEPEMVRGSRVFYPVNRRVFDDPRSHFVYDDAKSFFASANRRFDLILSEPSNPWVSGVSGLFTDEFYHRVRTYLTPDGVFGQWLHLYEINDPLVLSVIEAVHRNFPSYDIYRTASVDILIVASNRPRLPAPDWSVYRLPAIAQDLSRFYRITPEALEGTHLVSRAALAPLIGEAADANSDYFPLLDLGTEITRFEKAFAGGFSGLGDDRFDLGALITGRRENPGMEPEAPLEIERVRSRAISAALRENKPAYVANSDRGRYRSAASRYQTLMDRMAAGHAPADWLEFITRFLEVEADIHGGTMGWADEQFYARVLQFAERYKAPREAIATIRFMHGVASYGWTEAAGQVETLLYAFENDIQWMDVDAFRDGAVIALLRAGQTARAHAIFSRTEKLTTRRATDIRAQMLAAALASDSASRAAAAASAP